MKMQKEAVIGLKEEVGRVVMNQSKEIRKQKQTHQQLSVENFTEQITQGKEEEGMKGTGEGERKEIMLRRERKRNELK